MNISTSNAAFARKHAVPMSGKRVSRRALAAVLGGVLAGALLALCGAAHADPGMGRLFNTRAERAVLDANRGKVAAAANQAPGFGGSPAGMQQPSGAATMMPPTGAATMMPPGEGQTMMPPPGPQNMMPPAGSQAMMPPGADPAVAGRDTPATPPPPEQLQLNGVLRTSSGRSTVWLNNVPQSGAQNKFSNRNTKALTVTLPSGRKVLLQPGQRYDLADGRVKDINEP